MTDPAEKTPTGRPPIGERNFGSELNPTTLLVDPQRCLVHAPLPDEVRSPFDTAPLGLLLTLFDLGASQPALAAIKPDWTATLDMAMHSGAWLREGPVVIDNHLVRVGKKVVVVRADAYDGCGTDDLAELQHAIDRRALPLVGTGLLAFARLPRTAAADVDDYDPSSWVGLLRRARPMPVAPGTTIHQRMGFEVVDAPAGVLELARTPYVANSIGTINGGAQAIMLEAAAEAMRPGMVATDMQIHFLSQVKTGPARSAGTVLRDADGHSVVDLRLVDAGNEEQLLTLATVTLQPASRVPD